jgi:periplasmic divalent cation tolerance protein
MFYQVFARGTRRKARMSDTVVALTTLPADFDAAPLAQDLVAAGLAACINIVPGVMSVYTWKGVPQVEREQQLIIKTTSSLTDALWAELKARHPYDVPEFLVIPVVGGSEDYVQWVESTVGPRKES